MAELATLFRQFLYRDLAFILGGFIVMLSFTYALRGRIGFPPIDWQKLPLASTVLIAAAAYVIGYAVQDSLAVLGLTRTGRFEPGCICKWLYRRFSGVAWQATNYVGANDREFKFEIALGRRCIPEHVIQELGRIRSLKVISMCVGGCLAVSAVIFLIHLAFNHSSVVDRVIFFVSALLAPCLICLGWIKGMQEMQFYQSIHDAGFPLSGAPTVSPSASYQNNLGAVLSRLGERDSGTAKLEEAVAAFREALKERTRERVPLDWAMTQNNLGAVLSRLGERDSGTAKLEEAVVAFREALKEWTRERVPLQWAMTQNNLGNALSTLGERESGTARLEEAVAAYRDALKEYTRERVPLDWAMSFGNEGVALMLLAERRRDAAMAKTALSQINTAFETMRDGGHAPYAAYYEQQLPRARALVARLRGQ